VGVSKHITYNIYSSSRLARGLSGKKKQSGLACPVQPCLSKMKYNSSQRWVAVGACTMPHHTLSIHLRGST
jgi:hypothetical protein